jgi:hypothetical protein
LEPVNREMRIRVKLADKIIKAITYAIALQQYLEG